MQSPSIALPVVASVTADAATAPNHCVSPVFGGLDLYVFYGVNEQIVVAGCSQCQQREPVASRSISSVGSLLRILSIALA